MNHLPLMARFNAWANERIYDCAGRLPDDDYRADRKAFFGSVHATLNHLLVVDRLWTGRIEGQDRGIRSLDQILYDDFAELRIARRKEDRRLIELVDGLDEKRLEAPVRFRRIIGDGEEEARTGHILITLFNHQTHHRGQVHTLLTQCDIVPPPLDVLYFLEELGEIGAPGTIGGD
ncbi:MAG: DinB family protein [Alphaproteobacteria bacterium]